MSGQRKASSIALSSYRDQQFQGSVKEQELKLKTSSTLYIGNLSFFTSEDQIYHLFAKAGDVKRVIMGLDRNAKTPCGFCFVEFYTREDAEDAMRYVSGTRLDERIIRCDWDAGFIEGRQYGRGRSGGQVRDEFRADYDAGRGGFGKMLQSRVERFGEGGPPQRFPGRGKRKWQESEDSNADGSTEVITDLRQKLRRSAAERETQESSDKTDENGKASTEDEDKPETGAIPVAADASNVEEANTGDDAEKLISTAEDAEMPETRTAEPAAEIADTETAANERMEWIE